MRELLRI